MYKCISIHVKMYIESCINVYPFMYKPQTDKMYIHSCVDK
ncbi:hypothetical protein FHS57_005942 [Runella defluvii]|uniref:Uncharacterized protein n=1 Tax=Runella defluvii TaxID=370973 RepID=A0A7W5ZRT1_9BACT|nr:hypothetical protein [Runella defluvii]